MKDSLMVLIVLVIIYLCCVVLCTIEHNKKYGIEGMNPCGSCWALRVDK